MSVISVGRNGSAVVPCRLGLGCRPELGFSSSSLTHARRVTPAHTLTHTHALLHLPTHSFCRYTRHTYTNTHLVPVSAAVHTVRLQLVSTPLRFLVAGLSANIIPLVWTGLNRTVRVFVCMCLSACMYPFASLCGRCLLWSCDLVCICVGRCDFVHVNRAGGGGGYRWLVTALSPGCGGQSLVITELLCECPICYHLHRQCLCPSELVNSCFCAFINVKNNNYKAYSVYRLNILCGRFKAIEWKAIVPIPTVCLMLCGVSLISVRKKKIARFLWVFPLMRLEDYWLFTLEARLIPWAVLD